MRWLRLGLPVVGPLAFVCAWTLVSRSLESPFMPGWAKILGAFRDDWLFERVQSDLLPSLYRLCVGYVGGCLLGLVVGCALGLLPLARRILEPLIEFLRALPKVAIIPIFLVLFGIGDASKILIIGSATAVPVLLNAMDGVRSAEATLLDTCRVYQFSFWQEVAVRLRVASPNIFAGARTALAIAFVLMVVSEMFAATNGVGYFILIAQRTFDIPGMWGGILLLGAMGYLFSALLVGIERLNLKWYHGYKAVQKGSIK